MKRKILIISVVFFAGLGAFLYDSLHVNYNYIQGDRIELVDTYNHLEEEADLIIKAKVLPNKENKLDVTDDGIVIFGYTITKLQVEEVYKGEILKDAPVYITEEYYILDDRLGKTIFTQGNYVPAKEGGKYIFFLKKYDDATRYRNMYFPIDLEKGKYITDKNIDIENMTNEQLEIGPKDSKDYKELMKQVRIKYN